MARRNPTPGSQTSLREANRARIVASLKQHGQLTQVELAGATGLSPATVSNIVKELSASGILDTSATSRSGRRAVQVRLARKVGLVAGLHFSARRLRVAIADIGRTVVAESQVPLAPGHRHDAELDRAVLLLTDLADSLGVSLGELQAIGMGVPAPVDRRTGAVAAPWMLPGWADVDIAAAFARRTGRPVHVEAEANLGALAETRAGAARGAVTAAYLRAGHTVSAGLVLAGAVQAGHSGKAGQLGHVSVDPNGEPCACGNRGCLNTVAGGPALLRHFGPDSGMHRIGDLVLAAEAGDAASRRIVADAGRHIGRAAAALVDLLDPETIVVGGELSLAGELLLSPLRHELERSVLGGAAGAPAVVPAGFAAQAELQGAIALAVDHVDVVADTVPNPA
ncbi:ROK family transcriptional regulator [Arthrobacter ginkgonis]|uniref:ROK family transcriptional regulator n=1 Tax=Arthrobacter ginkgonis TaxID=1630594 RepID=A0ABP7BXH3_9MICC